MNNQKFKIFTGGAATGKTYRSQQEEKKYKMPIKWYAYQMEQYLDNTRRDADLIVIDECPPDFNFNAFIKKYSEGIYVKLADKTIYPDFILITQSYPFLWRKYLEMPNIEIIQFREDTLKYQLDNQILKKRVKILDKIEDAVSRFYPDEEEQHNEPEGDLGDIGEVCARILGYIG